MSAPRNVTLVVLATLLLPTACQIHSPGQLELARTLLSRYTASFADALAVTENLPAEEERLLAAYRGNYKLISSTTELALLEDSWAGLLDKTNTLNTGVEKIRQTRGDDQTHAKTAEKELAAVRKPLAAALAELNKGLKTADAAPTPNDQMTFLSDTVKGALTNIAAVKTALDSADQAATGDGMGRLKQAAERLRPLAPKLETYFQSVVTGPTRAKDQNAPLAVEATRLARDILAIEVDIIDQEITYQKELSGLAAETLQALPLKEQLPNQALGLKALANAANGTKPIAANLQALARAGNANEAEIRDQLVLVGTWYYIKVQSDRANDTHQLKARILAYRQAKLLDLAYDRQRRTLISYGLLAAVRYAEGGWKSQDTANLIGIIQAGLQAGLLAKI